MYADLCQARPFMEAHVHKGSCMTMVRAGDDTYGMADL
jgi:hypothetical protein